jgi:2-haloacid dehalogenase
MTEPVTTVVFDVGRVLFQWDLRFLFGKLIADPGKLEAFVTTVVTPDWHYQVDAGRDLAEVVAERIAEFPEHEDLIRAYAARFLETIPGPVPGSIELVEALHARGVPLFAITNFGAEFWARFRPLHPVFDRFGNIVVSGDEKRAKPGAEIYALAERRFATAPGAMLFVDDTLANVDAARARGWHGHHFTDAAGLERDLRGRGLLG